MLAVVFGRFLGVASSGPGGFRLTRLLRVVAGELWLDILKGVSWKGLCG